MQYQQTFTHFIKNTAIISSVQKGYIMDIGRIPGSLNKIYYQISNKNIETLQIMQYPRWRKLAACAQFKIQNS